MRSITNRFSRAIHLVAILALVLTQQACGDKKQAEPATQAQADSAAPADGTVLETMDSGGYTYVNVQKGNGTIWAASGQFKVKVGDKVSFQGGTLMNNFNSSTLNRTFDKIYFVQSIQVEGVDAPAEKAAAAPAKSNGKTLAPPKGLMTLDDPGAAMAPMNNQLEMPKLKAAEAPEGMDFQGLVKAEGGYTVEELFSKRSELAGKEVLIRGKAVKVNPQIMNKNWIHIQDGTGKAGENDLTITSKDVAVVGDTILVKGILGVDKDVGHGSKYPMIVEEAEVTVENR